MKAYMVWPGGDPGDGAALVLCNTAQEAKKLTWRAGSEWFDAGYLSIRVKWLRNADVEWLALRYDAGFIERPDCCKRCKVWIAVAHRSARCPRCWIHHLIASAEAMVRTVESCAHLFPETRQHIKLDD